MLPIIQGFVTIRKCTIGTEEIDFILLSRRSKLRAGNQLNSFFFFFLGVNCSWWNIYFIKGWGIKKEDLMNKEIVQTLLKQNILFNIKYFNYWIFFFTYLKKQNNK